MYIIELQEAKIPLVSEHFESNDVTISLDWKQNNLHYLYNISILPQPAIATSVENGSVNFTVCYNTQYNVSIYTAPPCGEYNLTKFVELFYGKY